MSDSVQAILKHQAELRACSLCPQMIGPPVVGQPVASPLLLIGQAPGDKEPKLARPFAWTAGKTLFKWFASIGLEEAQFRQLAYMAAICRCFPGKRPRGGDRPPDDVEIAHCSRWLKREFELLTPQLVVPVGKMAIAQFVPLNRLVDVIGRRMEVQWHGHRFDMIPLPHPSGASTWHRTSPGKELLEQALEHLARHEVWRGLVDAAG